MALSEKIGIENLLNAILVDADIRPAMLVQPADYDEATGEDPKTKTIIEAIQMAFPELLQSDNYKIYQGIIISKTNYNEKEISLEKMGEILGYPCSKDFDKINPNITPTTVISVYVYLKNGRRIQLFVNVCKDINNIEAFRKYATSAENVFSNPKYNSLLSDIEIKGVDIEVENTIPIPHIITNILANKNLEKAEKDKILNILYNFGFSNETVVKFNKNIQYNNPIHRGILLDLLVRELSNTLSPFYPLQEYPKQYADIQIITRKWEQYLIAILEDTKEKTQPTTTHKTSKPTARRSKSVGGKTRRKRCKINNQPN